VGILDHVTENAALIIILVAALAVPIWTYRQWRFGTSALGSSAERATYSTLHTAGLAAPALRMGLNAESAMKSAKYLRQLAGTPAFSIHDIDGLLAWDGEFGHHADTAQTMVVRVIHSGRAEVLGPERVACQNADCPLHYAVIAPLVIDDVVLGAIAAFDRGAPAALVRTVTEISRWVNGQLELAELDDSRTRLAEAQVKALRAQISPHFIYNALNAIASYVRTDPEHARELLLDFADFTRYSFRAHGQFTTLSEELSSIDRYLTLERARFGDRLQVELRIAPEVLNVTVPFLCLQPIVENAVRHGLENKTGTGHIAIDALDMGTDCWVTIEDDGVGADPERIRRILAGDTTIDSIGVANVDERLRSVYGDGYGLVIETAPGAGTKVTVRVPKFQPQAIG
jgi:two-component system LytT family sensor kinase